jgi:antitoxin YefM
VTQDHEPVLITRGSKPAGVLISLEDYASFEETAYLLSSPQTAARLSQAIGELTNKS